MTPTETAKAAGTRESLTVDGICIGFSGFKLQDISFSVPAGAVTALLGHNGAGKTTTLRAMMGLLKKDAGQVRLGTLSHESEIAFRNRVGFVPEEGSFYRQMTVREIAAFAAPFYTSWNAQRCSELAATLGLDMNAKLGVLSKGTRMKVSVLLAFAHDPDALLLDEPTSGLDPRSRADVAALIRDAAQARGCAVVMSTHDLKEVEQIADRVVVIDRGRVLVERAMEELRSSAGPGREWSLERYYLEVVR
jgi:ABC-2 type transport system ATP-binding protein